MPVQPRPKIAIIHPDLGWGGSEACALWAMEALKDDYDVCLITSSAVEFKKLNEYYGTSINSNQISVMTVSMPFILKKLNSFFALKYYRLARFCKRRANEFDVMFSSYNPMDFSKKGVQYILDPTFTCDLLQLCAGYPRGLRGWFYQNSPWRRFYLNLSKTLSNLTEEGIKKNLTLVDSDWTGQLTSEVYGMKSTTVYPPVPSNYPQVNWEDREDGFVCIGRINSEKRIDKIIEILEEVRKRKKEIHFHIIGKIHDLKYARNVNQLLRKNQDWIFMEGEVASDRKIELVAKHKYGIHGRINEPFGIAPAEMVKAGCIVWVASGGGAGGGGESSWSYLQGY